jgi:hypothetical protein
LYAIISKTSIICTVFESSEMAHFGFKCSKQEYDDDVQ